jgi:hypothetical protein
VGDDAHAFHQDMDRRCSGDAEDIKHKIACAGATVEDIPAAREGMVRDIAAALFAARGALASLGYEP